jgi:hypothetical protein
MKKLSLLLTLFVLALSFTSCDKEGVYNPNKKISKSYLDTGEGKQLTSSWNWNGKLLRTIDYYDLISGEIAYTHIFSYNDKDQIVSISDITNNLTTKYFYYGNRFDKIVSYHNDEITETYFFEYDADGPSINWNKDSLETVRNDYIDKTYGPLYDIVVNQ